jgi:hypothetical protein
MSGVGSTASKFVGLLSFGRIGSGLGGSKSLYFSRLTAVDVVCC